MLKPEVVRLVEELLAGGQYSQRVIALRTGVSRATIAAIAKGQRCVESPPPEQPAAPAVRCKQCGAKAVMPCRTCEVRRYQLQRLADRRWLAFLARRTPLPHRRPAA